MLTYDAAWNSDFAAFSSAAGRQLSEKRKAVMLFKFDPFSSKWKKVALDMANANEEFKTNRVGQALGQ